MGDLALMRETGLSLTELRGLKFQEYRDIHTFYRYRAAYAQRMD